MHKLKKLALSINRETIRNMTAHEIVRAVGGEPKYPDPSFVYTCGPSACHESSCQPTMPNVCAP